MSDESMLDMDGAEFFMTFSFHKGWDFILIYVDATHINEIYPDLRNYRAVLNIELPDRSTIPPLYSRVNTSKVRTFGAYPTVESIRFTDNSQNNLPLALMHLS